MSRVENLQQLCDKKDKFNMVSLMLGFEVFYSHPCLVSVFVL